MALALASLTRMSEALVAIAGVAVSATPLSVAGAAVGLADLYAELLPKIPEPVRPGVSELVLSIEAKLGKQLSTLTADEQILIPQMIEQTSVSGDEVFQAGRDADAIVTLMVSKLTDPSHADELLRHSFRRAVAPLLRAALDDPAVAAGLAPAFQTFVAQRLALIEAKVAALIARFETSARSDEYTLKTVLAIARRIAGQDYDIETAGQAFDQSIANLSPQDDQAAAADDRVALVLRRMAEFNRAGDIDAAVRVVDQSLDQIEAEKSRLLDIAIRQHIVRQDSAATAQRQWDKIQMEIPDGPGRLAALHDRHLREFDRIRDQSLPFEAEVAMHHARRSYDIAGNADERGTALNDLGRADVVLAERATGTHHLEEAIAAFRGALGERSRDRVPMDWAATQNNLGLSLKMLGTRQKSTARLEEAAAALRSSLEVRTRDKAPLDWALTQANLADTLRSIGESDNDIGRLAEAVSLYPPVLEERASWKVPRDHADSQNNYGIALRELGRRQDGTLLLDQARDAFQAALAGRTRAERPLNWASTQSNLARLEMAYFEKDADAGHLDRAAALASLALEVFRDRQSRNAIVRTETLLAEIAALRTPAPSPD